MSKPFAAWLLPHIKQHFPDFPDRSASDFYEAINVIKSPSLIRVEADEVTYPMHIILRYEIERGLIAGSIKVGIVVLVTVQGSVKHVVSTYLYTLLADRGGYIYNNFTVGGLNGDCSGGWSALLYFGVWSLTHQQGPFEGCYCKLCRIVSMHLALSISTEQISYNTDQRATCICCYLLYACHRCQTYLLCGIPR